MNIKADEYKKEAALSIGSIVGGSTPTNKSWENAIETLMKSIKHERINVDVPLKLNVVFHVPGNILKPEFEGVRTGRFSKSMAMLMVQVAVPEEVPPDPLAHLKDAVGAAIDEAARWAAKRNVPIDVVSLREVLNRS